MVLFFCSVFSFSFGLELTQEFKGGVLDQIEYFVDNEGTLTVDEVLQIDQKHFVQKEFFNPGYSTSAYWVKIQINNQSDFEKNLLLEVFEHNIDYIDFYGIQKGRVVIENHTGTEKGFYSRALWFTEFVFPADLKEKESITVLLRLQNIGGTLATSISVWDRNHYLYQAKLRDFILTGLFGFLGLLLVVSFFNWVLYKEHIYLIYAAYVFFLFWTFLSTGGVLNQYLFDNNLFLTRIIRAPLMALSTIFFLWFVNAFLKTDKHLGVWYNWLTKILFAVLGLTALMFFTDIDIEWVKVASVKSLNLSILFALLQMLTLVIYRMIQKDKSAFYVACAYGLLIVSVFAMILRNNGVIPSYDVLLYTIPVSVAVETVFFLFLLSFRSVQRAKYTQLLELKLDRIQKEREEHKENEVKSVLDDLPVKDKKEELVNLDEERMLKEVHKAILRLFKENEVYLDADLTVQKLADQLEIGAHYVSKSINSIEKVHFFDFINLYRVSKAKQVLGSAAYANYTVEGVASECGFNNRASFYKAFKKFTGETPALYRKSLQKGVK